MALFHPLGTGKARNSRWRGISTRLTLGLIALLLITGMCAGTAIISMISLTTDVDRLIGGKFNQIVLAEHLAQEAQILALLSPKLVDAHDEFEVDNLVGQINDMFGLINQGIDDLRAAGLQTDIYQNILQRRDELRVGMDELAGVVRLSVKAKTMMAVARNKIDALEATTIAPPGPSKAPSPGSLPVDASGLSGEAAAKLAMVLYEASLATQQSAIDRSQLAANDMVGDAYMSGVLKGNSGLMPLIGGQESVFNLRRRQLTLENQLQGATHSADRLSNQLVYTVSNLAVETRRLAEQERQERRHDLTRTTLQLLSVVGISVIVSIGLVFYLRRNVLHRMTRLRDSVHDNAVGDSAAISDDGDDEIGDVARSVRHLIEEIKSRETELRRLATTDSLSGLANRRYFMERCQQEITRCRERGQPVAVLMADIDHFKRVNDTWGHAVGDETIRRFAAICREMFREVDIVGRLGGEEFATLMPDTGLEGAIAAAERLREAIEARPVVLPDGQAIPVTVSVGVAALRADDVKVDQIIGRADGALYDAKHNGRNQVSVEPSPEGSKQDWFAEDL